MNTNPPNEQLIEAIPDPQAVRERLAENLRDAKLLRHLLKLSERAAKDREGREGAANAR